MRGDEVDAGVRAPRGAFVEVRAARQAIGELRERPVGAAPEVPHGVAILAVPLRPQRRKVADLIAALSDVPGLGDQLDLAHDRVLLDEVEERREPIHLVELSRERRGQIEPEPIHVHLDHPVAQAVHDELQHVGMPHVHRVAGAGVVHVVAPVVGRETVVGGVVQTLHREHRPEVIALGGVVVDHVENHLDARLVHRLHEVLELLHLLAALAARVLVVRREVADRVVAPVVDEPAIAKARILDELMHGQKLDGRHAEPLQILDRLGVRHAGIRAAQLVGDERVRLGEALDVRLVDDGLVPRRLRPAVLSPVEERVDDDALRHERRAVEIVAGGFWFREVIRKDGLVPVPLAVNRLRIGIEQQLGGIGPRAALRRPGPVHPKAVALPRLHVGQIAVPAERRSLGQVDAHFGALVVEETQLDALRGFGEHREVRADSVEGRAERRVVTGPDAHRGEMVSHGGSGLRAQGSGKTLDYLLEDLA